MSAEVPPSKITVKLMPDWGAGPLWVADGGVSEPYDAEEITEVLPLSAGLRADIAAWDERFQATLDQDDPRNSGTFPTPEDEATFVAEGRELARRVQAEAPDAVVLYETIDGRMVPLDEPDSTAT